MEGGIHESGTLKCTKFHHLDRLCLHHIQVYHIGNRSHHEHLGLLLLLRILGRLLPIGVVLGAGGESCHEHSYIQYFLFHNVFFVLGVIIQRYTCT